MKHFLIDPGHGPLPDPIGPPPGWAALKLVIAGVLLFFFLILVFGATFKFYEAIHSRFAEQDRKTIMEHEQRIRRLEEKL